jgi:hypothetical protein
VFPLLPGLHNFKWEYTKDQDVTLGLDAAFVDFIEFPSIQYTSADAGPDASIFECQDYSCLGTATYYDSLMWTSTGSGTFTDPLSEHTLYKLSKADKEAGFVSLILTVYGPSITDYAADTVNVVIIPKPTAFAGLDTGICLNDDFQVSDASATNYVSLSWNTMGTGTFSDPSILKPIYYPGADDTLAGSVRLVFRSYSSNVESCGVAFDTLLLTFYPLPVIPLVKEFQRCTGYSATLDATTVGSTHYLWQPGGETTAHITVDSTGIGVGQKTFTVEVTGEHGCVSQASSTVSFEECSEKKQLGNIFFRVFPNPSRDDFYVELFSDVKQDVNYKVSDDAGSVILTGDLNFQGQKTLHLNLFHLPAGSYLFTLRTGKDTASQKIVIF